MVRRVVAAVTGSVVAALLLGGAWVAFDALDLAPGVLTLEPPPTPAAPFPSAPAAVDVPAAEAVLADLDPQAPLPDAATVTAWARALVANSRMGTSTSVVVRDVLTDEVLADVSGGTPQIPASTAKILTAMAALTALGPDRTLPTTVVEGEPGQLVLVGGGDMMLAAGASNPDAVVGRAGLVDLAAQVTRALRQQGVDQVSLQIDDSLFSGPGIHPEWVPSDVAHGYVASIAPVAVEIAKTDPSQPYPRRYADPAGDAAGRLAALLEADGFTVADTITRTTATSTMTELGRVESAPVAEIVTYMLHVSENTIAEVLGRLVAVERGLPGSFDGATTAVLAEVAVDGVDVTGAVLRDCSGLSAFSQIPARVLVDAVVLAAGEGGRELLPVLTDLPVGGWVGTLNDRFTSGPGTGTVRAKTGSLPGVTSLAGTVLTEDGRLLAFAVLADATGANGQTGPRSTIDAWVQQLAGCGCSAGG